MKRLSPFTLLIGAAAMLAGQGMGPQPHRQVMESEVASEHLEGFLAAARLEALIREKGWSEAGALAEEAVRQDPGNGSAWYALGVVHFGEQRYTQALRALRRAEQCKLETAGLHRLLGLCYYFLQQYGLFEQQMERGKTAAPQNGEFDFLLGRYYHSIRGDCTRAIPMFDKALSLHFSSVKVLYNRGDCYDQNGELALAEQDFLSAIEQIRNSSASDSWPFQALTRLYLRTDRVDDAMSLAREALRIQGGSADTHILLAKVLTEKGETQASIVELRRAADLSPSDEALRYQLYRLYLKLGDREAAQRELAAFRKLTGGEDVTPKSQ
jgi:tetratricopeptide (TPR) repeat protein